MLNPKKICEMSKDSKKKQKEKTREFYGKLQNKQTAKGSKHVSRK